MRRLGEALEFAGLIAVCATVPLFAFCWFTILPAIGILWSLGVLK